MSICILEPLKCFISLLVHTCQRKFSVRLIPSAHAQNSVAIQLTFLTESIYCWMMTPWQRTALESFPQHKTGTLLSLISYQCAHLPQEVRAEGQTHMLICAELLPVPLDAAIWCFYAHFFNKPRRSSCFSITTSTSKQALLVYSRGALPISTLWVFPGNSHHNSRSCDFYLIRWIRDDVYCLPPVCTTWKTDVCCGCALAILCCWRNGGTHWMQMSRMRVQRKPFLNELAARTWVHGQV